MSSRRSSMVDVAELSLPKQRILNDTITTQDSFSTVTTAPVARTTTRKSKAPTATTTRSNPRFDDSRLSKLIISDDDNESLPTIDVSRQSVSSTVGSTPATVIEKKQTVVKKAVDKSEPQPPPSTGFSSPIKTPVDSDEDEYDDELMSTTQLAVHQQQEREQQQQQRQQNGGRSSHLSSSSYRRRSVTGGSVQSYSDNIDDYNNNNINSNRNNNRKRGPPPSNSSKRRRNINNNNAGGESRRYRNDSATTFGGSAATRSLSKTRGQGLSQGRRSHLNVAGDNIVTKSLTRNYIFHRQPFDWYKSSEGVIVDDVEEVIQLDGGLRRPHLNAEYDGQEQDDSFDQVNDVNAFDEQDDPYDISDGENDDDDDETIYNYNGNNKNNQKRPETTASSEKDNKEEKFIIKKTRKIKQQTIEEKRQNNQQQSPAPLPTNVPPQSTRTKIEKDERKTITVFKKKTSPIEQNQNADTDEVNNNRTESRLMELAKEVADKKIALADEAAKEATEAKRVALKAVSANAAAKIALAKQAARAATEAAEAAISAERAAREEQRQEKKKSPPSSSTTTSMSLNNKNKNNVKKKEKEKKNSLKCASTSSGCHMYSQLKDFNSNGNDLINGNPQQAELIFGPVYCFQPNFKPKNINNIQQQQQQQNQQQQDNLENNIGSNKNNNNNLSKPSQTNNNNTSTTTPSTSTANYSRLNTVGDEQPKSRVVNNIIKDMMTVATKDAKVIINNPLEKIKQHQKQQPTKTASKIVTNHQYPRLNNSYKQTSDVPKIRVPTSHNDNNNSNNNSIHVFRNVNLDNNSNNNESLAKNPKVPVIISKDVLNNNKNKNGEDNNDDKLNKLCQDLKLLAAYHCRPAIGNNK